MLATRPVSRWRGVTWHPIALKWKVCIRTPSGQRVFLGYYRCEGEAAMAWNQGAMNWGVTLELNDATRR